MNVSATPRRFAHLWFHRLSTDRTRRAQPVPASPLALVESRKGALRLTAVDKAAERDGLVAGMTLADARARTPQVQVVQADSDADLALLMRLGDACRRYTPALALHAPDGLDLDVTGCADLFGGEDAMLQDVRERTARFRLSLRAAVADTPALAYAAARYASGGVVAVGEGQAALAPLPVAALRLEPEGCAVLEGLGLKRVGQILDLPRPTLARRLGVAALDRLDEALGRRASPLEQHLERPSYMAEQRLFEPISEGEQVLAMVADLARALAIQLEGRAVGGAGFGLELFRMDGTVKRLEVSASRPVREPSRITALFAERLAGLNDGLQADFGFDQLRLTAFKTRSLQAEAADLLRSSGGRALIDLADRVYARSSSAADRLAPVDAHRPETADAAVSLQARADWAGEPKARFEDTPLRPLRLFRPPQAIEVPLAEVPEGPPARFVWRRVSRIVIRAEGPERLEPEWARDPAACTRDYYRLEDERGLRYWVFREGDYDAVAGDGAPASPRWYIQGLFG